LWWGNKQPGQAGKNLSRCTRIVGRRLSQQHRARGRQGRGYARSICGYRWRFLRQSKLFLCPCLRDDVVPAARRCKLLFADLALVADAKELEHIVVTVLLSKKAAGILIERLLSTQQLVFLGAAV